MKNVLKASTIFLMIGLLAIQLACSEDDHDAPKKRIISFSIPENYLYPNQEIWVFLTTKNGELLEVKQIENNTEVVFDISDTVKRNESFTLHTLLKNNIAQYKYASFKAESYTNITPGKYWLKPSLEQIIAGQHVVAVNNKPANFNSTYICGPDVIGIVIDLPSDQYGGLITKSSSSMFYTFLNLFDVSLAPKYAYFPEARPGDFETVNFSELPSMTLKTLQLNEVFDQINVQTSAFEHTGDEKAYGIGGIYNFDNSIATVAYPGSLFPEYITKFLLDKDNTQLIYQKRGEIPSAIKYYSGLINSLTFANKKLNLESSGTFDLTTITSAVTWKKDNYSYALRWDYYTGETGNVEYTVPEFPAAILAANPELEFVPEQKFNSATAIDYDSFKNYNEYIKFQLQSDDASDRFFSESTGLKVDFSLSSRKGVELHKIKNLSNVPYLQIDPQK